MNKYFLHMHTDGHTVAHAAGGVDIVSYVAKMGAASVVSESAELSVTLVQVKDDEDLGTAWDSEDEVFRSEAIERTVISIAADPDTAMLVVSGRLRALRKAERAAREDAQDLNEDVQDI